MKLNELLNEEFFNVIEDIAAGDIIEEANSKKLKERKKQRRKKRQEKARSEIGADDRFEITPKAKAIKKAHRTFDWEDDDPKFRDGRERLITAVIHIVQKNGGALGRQEARDYLFKKYKQWKARSSKAKWIMDLEPKAVELGFNPRDYIDQKPGQSSGVGAPGMKEYEGRAYFFTCLMNGFANHFLKQQGLELKTKQAHMKKPNSEEKKKINKKENERVWKLFHPKENKK